MATDLTSQHRIRINGQDYHLNDFKVHPAPPATITPAGIFPGVEEALRADGPPQPERYSFDTVTFGCDLTLEPGKSYDYSSPENQNRGLTILSGSLHKYRGVLQQS